VLCDPAARMASFAQWCFEQGGSNGKAIVVGGHSLWFKSFFQAYLGRRVDHIAKRRKMTNSGVISFTLQRGLVGRKMLYRIDESSIRVLYGGFK